MKFERIWADIERICGVIHRKKADSTIGFGAVVFYSSCIDDRTFSAKERLQKLFENILRDAKEVVGNSCHVALQSTRIHVSAESAWAAAAVVLRPKNI